MGVFTLTNAVDNFTGTPGQDNFFFLTPTTLQVTDMITGVLPGPFSDVLIVTAGGTITAAQFAGVTNIERLVLASAGNNVSLTNGLIGNSSNGIFAVQGDAGNDTVNAGQFRNGELDVVVAV